MTYKANIEFKPPLLIRHPMIQSAMASFSLGARKNNPILNHKVSELISVGKVNGENVHLLGEWSLQPGKNGRGLAILLHGWEGSSDSSYILRTGKMLFQKGFDVFRLNLRDHGNTHHLNRGVFNGSLLEEVYRALHLVSNAYQKFTQADKPVLLAGFSLGGNYAIRLTALHNSEKKKILNLKSSFAISPALNPYDATLQMDRHFILGKYFLNKWMSSLEKKQEHFPSIYDFTEMKEANSVMSLTEMVVQKYSRFNNAREYFQSYTIDHSWLGSIQTPLSILTSADDPIITVDHFYEFIDSDLPKNIEILITNYGGHNGFYYDRKLDCLYERIIADFSC